ncbi:MAG: hypothetical protein ABIK62_05245 [candidate division WOR-3 bacterium]
MTIRPTRAIRALRATARALGCRVYLVGGPLRDMLLGRRFTDIDVAVEGDIELFGQALKTRLGGKLTFHPEFGTGTIELGRGRVIDLARTRSEVYDAPGALPRVAPADIRADLGRRDFTVNALAYDLLSRQLLDPLGGLDDLKARRIRVLHRQSFRDDPARIFRAVRLAERLGFVIEPRTRAWLRAAVRDRLLDRISGARIRNELALITGECNWRSMLSYLNRCGVLAALFRRLTVAEERSLRGLDAAEPRVRLNYLCYLLNADRRLPLEREEIATIADLRQFRPARLARAQRPSRIAELLRPLTPEARAILAGRYPALARKIGRYERQYARVTPLLSGDDLAALGLEPGPIYGQILDRLRAARLDGQVRTRNDEQALVWGLIAHR